MVERVAEKNLPFFVQRSSIDSLDELKAILSGRVFEPTAYDLASRTGTNPGVNLLKKTGVLNKYCRIADLEGGPKAFSQLFKDLRLSPETQGDFRQFNRAEGGVLVICPQHSGWELPVYLAAMGKEGVDKEIKILGWPFGPFNDPILAISPEMISPLVSRRLQGNPLERFYRLVYKKQLPESPRAADEINDETLWKAAIALEVDQSIVFLFPTGSRFNKKWGRAASQVLNGCLSIEETLDGWQDEIPGLGKVSLCSMTLKSMRGKLTVKTSVFTPPDMAVPSLKGAKAFGIYGQFSDSQREELKKRSQQINRELQAFFLKD